MVRPSGEWSFPEIYISKTNKYPNNPNNSDIVCDNWSFNLCAIDSDNITEVIKFIKKHVRITYKFLKGDTYYIGVLCYENCTYTIRVDYSEEYYFTLGQYMYF